MSSTLTLIVLLHIAVTFAFVGIFMHYVCFSGPRQPVRKQQPNCRQGLSPRQAKALSVSSLNFATGKLRLSSYQPLQRGEN